MVQLRSVDVMSCAKIYGVFHVALGVLFGLFFVFIALIGLATAPGQQKFGMIGILIFAALAPFLYGALGFVIGAIGALLYNWIASALGGIQMELVAVPAHFVPPVQPPAPNVSV